MDYKELFKESISTLLLNKARTGLAMLGVVIGIGSVIAMISIGQGSQKRIEEQIRSLGSNLLTISPGSQERGGIRSPMAQVKTLSYDDAKAIMTSEEISSVKAVAPSYQSNAQLVAGRNNTNVTVVGTTANYFQMRNLKIEYGNSFTDSHLNLMSNVVILGSEAAEKLFTLTSNAVNKNLRIDGESFLILGVLESKGASGMISQDNIAYIPLTTAQKKLFGVNYLSSISVEAIDAEVMGLAEKEIGTLLMQRHKIMEVGLADFSIMSQEDMLETTSEITGTFTTLLAGIAAISLVVGGIGIMNIMLVTVTERTREIGLRKALGAMKKTITTQFLIESVLITFIGGIIGIIIGIVVAFILSQVMSSVFTISIPSVFLAFGVSGAIGILFGWYPAKKAAELEPIVALRYE